MLRAMQSEGKWNTEIIENLNIWNIGCCIITYLQVWTTPALREHDYFYPSTLLLQVYDVVGKSKPLYLKYTS